MCNMHLKKFPQISNNVTKWMNNDSEKVYHYTSFRPWSEDKRMLFNYKIQ